MPSVRAGRLFHFDRVGNESRLRCLNALTGQVIWEARLPTDYTDAYGYDGGPRSSPTIDEQFVFTHGADGTLACHSVVDGRLVWQRHTSREHSVVPNFFGVGGSPVRYQDLLIVQVGGSPKGADPNDFAALRGNGSCLVAYEAATGRERWKTGNDLAGYASPRIVGHGDGARGYLLARGGLTVFDPDRGRELLHFPWRARVFESVNACNPVVVGSQVFLTECYGPGGVLLETKTGKPEVVWSDVDRGRAKSLACHWSTPIYHGGHLYGCHGRHAGEAELRCVEWATGKVKWRVPDLERVSLLGVDGHAVALTEAGTLLLVKLSPERYTEISRWEPRLADSGRRLLEYPCWAAPILADGRLYVRGRDWLVCCDWFRPKSPS